MDNPFARLISAQKQGRAVGLYSVCSANRFVLEAAMLRARREGTYVLIEATSNQVNQDGGYTGMTPAAFVAHVQELAHRMDYPFARVILGGDHLGPNPWQELPAAEAMARARELVRLCVLAGFRKIHLDTSMRCSDDPGEAQSPLPMELAVARAAELCRVCERAHAEFKTAAPAYVIGTEVPPPGGATHALAGVTPTPVEEAAQTREATRAAFVSAGLHEAWGRVIALVVQPGVEFGDDAVVPYDRKAAHALVSFIAEDDQLVYEAHSTDYQGRQALRQLVEDHFAILKVGPWLTFAFREAIFALAQIESEWLAGRKSVQLSHLREVLEQVMLARPQYWRKHYHGDEWERAFARRFSYSDRVRYYWADPGVAAALELMLANLRAAPPPLALLSQYLPDQYWAVREGALANRPEDLIYDKILEIFALYAEAARCRTWFVPQ